MLSRVAERIYWMARYLERAENTARLINVNTHLLLDLPKKVTLGWEPMVDILGCKTVFEELYPEYTERNVIKFLSVEGKNPSSISSCIYFARENARTIRDLIPAGAWEAINDLHDMVKEKLSASIARKNRFEFLQTIIEKVQQISGELDGTMLRGSGYRFMKLGRYLERADMTSRILDVRSQSLLVTETEDLLPFEQIQWVSVLNSMSAYQGYRQKVRGILRSSTVLEFLIRNHYFPRSFAHCMGEAKYCLRNLPHNKKLLQDVESIVERLDSLDFSVVQGELLYLLIDELQIELANLHNNIAKTYFSLERTSRKEKSKESSLAEA